jgi:spore maturation protein CgeB
MKVLYVGIQAENYNPKRKYSFEYNNFYLTLKSMPGVTVIEHPFDRILEVGKKKFNEELLEIVMREKPDMLFAFMYSDEFDEATLLKIKNETSTKTFAWFADDYWRFFNYSRHLALYFSYVVTTYSKALDWYRDGGFNNAILSQWACNTSVYKPVVESGTNAPIKKDIDVSFVGQYKPARAKVIRELERAGIHVEAFGFGWPNGRVSNEEMMKIFSRSKINLNLNVRANLLYPSAIGRIVLKRSRAHLVPDLHFIDNFRAYLHIPVPHTHARPFELAGTGGFVISGKSEDIGAYYKEGKEMVFYSGTDDLIEKIRYYLAHTEEREAIARAGYERTITEHTYIKRFEELFKLCQNP